MRQDFPRVVPSYTHITDDEPAQAGQTTPDATLNTLICRMPETHRLFEMLGRNEHPDFLTIMRAMSEFVAFYTDCDINDEPDWLINFNMSQKKCPFCS